MRNRLEHVCGCVGRHKTMWLDACAISTPYVRVSQTVRNASCLKRDVSLQWLLSALTFTVLMHR